MPYVGRPPRPLPLPMQVLLGRDKAAFYQLCIDEGVIPTGWTLEMLYEAVAFYKENPQGTFMGGYYGDPTIVSAALGYTPETAAPPIQWVGATPEEFQAQVEAVKAWSAAREPVTLPDLEEERDDEVGRGVGGLEELTIGEGATIVIGALLLGL